MPTEASPLALDRPDVVGRVRDVLDRAGFGDRGVRERLTIDPTDEFGFGPLERPRVLRRTRGGDPLDTLIRVFLAGVAVPPEDFRRAVAPMDPADWAALGLVELDGDGVRRRVAVMPAGPLLIAHDACRPDASVRRDHVMGIAESTATFARAIVPVRARRALDLGTGCGFVALRLAATSGRVLATDVNPRAVAMTRFNAQLNRVDNLDCDEGSLFEPAGGRRFDLVASNPPFVVSPQDELIYRDGGMSGDAFCERLFREAPAHLAEGGFAQVICNWVRLEGQDWLERLSGWFDGSGCDVWIAHWATAEPGDYARNWLLQADLPPEPDRFAEEFARWTDYYDRLRIEEIDFGIIVLRRRTGGRNWLRVDLGRDPDHCGGAAFLRGFVAHDLVARLDASGTLMDAVLACPPEVRVEQRLSPDASGWAVDGVDCRLGDGRRFEGEFRPIEFHLLGLCRGGLPLADVIPQVAGRLGADRDAIREQALAAARGLILQGFLVESNPRGASPDGRG